MSLKPYFSCRQLISLLIFCAIFSGCSTARLEDVVRIRRGSKQTALQERLERFNRARYWGGLSESVAFVKPEYQSEFIRLERNSTDIQRIVRTDITRVELTPDGSTAEVEMVVRYFEKPTYLVKTRREGQIWSYERFAGGWLLSALAAEGGTVDDSGPTPMRGMPSRDPKDF